MLLSSLDEENDVEINPDWFSPSQIVQDTFVPSIHTIQLGKLDLNPDSNATTVQSSNNVINATNDEILIVEKHTLHPYFHLQSRGDEPPYPDIAILKLYGSSQTVDKYARLDNPQSSTDWTQQSLQTDSSPEIILQSQYNFTFTTMGYGMDESNLISNILKQTTLNYVPNEVCKAQGLWDLVNDDMICASGEGTRDSCNGDSGGPLFWQKQDGSDVQVGIVSWGVGCADEQYPGVCKFVFMM
jgi:secreted trypsin-like serine protease